MNIQTETAIKIFTDLYGEPIWINNPKENQEPAKIIKLWDEELSGYTVEQVKQACYKVAKRKRSMTFPTINHIMVELAYEEKENQQDIGTSEATISLLKRNGYSDEVIDRVVFRLHNIHYKQEKPNEYVDTEKQRKINQIRSKFFENYGYKDIYKLILNNNQKYFEISKKWKEFKKTLPDDMREGT